MKKIESLIRYVEEFADIPVMFADLKGETVVLSQYVSDESPCLQPNEDLLSSMNDQSVDNYLYKYCKGLHLLIYPVKKKNIPEGNIIAGPFIIEEEIPEFKNLKKELIISGIKEEKIDEIIENIPVLKKEFITDLISFVKNSFALINTEKKQRFVFLDKNKKPSKKAFNIFTEYISDVVWEMNKDFVITEISDSVKSFAGYKPEEVAGCKLSRFITEDKFNKFKEMFNVIINKKRSTFKYEGDVILKNRHIFVEIVVQGIYNDDGELTGFFGITRDVTERKKFEQILQLSEARFKTIFNTISAAIGTVNSSGSYMQTNESTCELFGFTKKEMFNRSLYDFVFPVYKEQIEKAVASIASRENDYFRYEIKLVQKNGTPFWGDISGEPIINDMGKVDSIIIIIFDITDRKNAEEELNHALRTAENASRMKSQFISNITHEIRTPMSGIIGYLSLLHETGLSTVQKEYIEYIEMSSKKLLSLMNDLIDFSKIESKEIKPKNREFLVREYIHNIAKPFAVAARKKGLEFHVKFDESIPENLKGDADKLKIILTKLIDNAVKFTEKGEVALQISGYAKGLTRKMTLNFRVIDTGIGIPKEKHSEIFESFTQADGTATRKFEGSGLGLSIAKNLVQTLNGEISVQSELGKGSIFNFLLEFAIPEKPVKAEEKVRTEVQDKHKIRILLAEDEFINKKYVTAILNKRGYSVVNAADGKETVDRLKKDSFDVVLMDIKMPNMDGLQATKAIREGFCGLEKKAIPIIAITAHAMKGDREKFLSAGMDDYIPKPVEPKYLFKIIEKHALKNSYNSSENDLLESS